MLRIERPQKNFTRLREPTLAGASISERYDLQEFIFNSPEQFFAEIGLELFVLAKELSPSEVVQDRIDVLAIDRDGRLVVIELKRSNHKLQLVQTIAYAAMIAKWTPEDVLSLLTPQRRAQFDDFIGVEADAVNREQRILLMAEAYDFEVLIAAEWLHETYGVDIVCCRLTLATDEITQTEYLSCTTVFPAPELAKQAVPRRGGSRAPSPWSSWEAALSTLGNSAMHDFFKREIDANRESNLRDKTLCYRIGGKRRFFLSARAEWAYCWQDARFAGDYEFWSRAITRPESVKPVKSGKALSFVLSTANDFSLFHEAATNELLSVEWSLEISLPESDDEAAETRAASVGK
jgi:hypothetical protein